MRKIIQCIALIVPLSPFVMAADISGAADTSAISEAKQSVTKWMLTDQSFVEKAATSNHEEIELSKQALEKSKDPKIRKLAQQMVTDHTKARGELAAIAKSKALQLPTALDSAHKKDTDKLSDLSGEKFDKAYTEKMQAAHDKAVNLFAAAAEDRKLDPQLQAFAATTLPTLREHQHKAHLLTNH